MKRVIVSLACAGWFVVMADGRAVADTPQTLRNVELPVKLTEAGVNKFLAKQWNSAGFPKVITGTEPITHCQYTFTLATPTVTFENAVASVNLSVTVTSTSTGAACLGGPFTLAFSPTISIPAGQVTSAGVKAFLTDIAQKVSTLGVPQWVKDAVTSAYVARFGTFPSPDNLVLYPSLLLGKVASHWFDQRSLNLDGANPFQLGWQVVPGTLILKPSINLRSGPADGTGGFLGPKFHVRFYTGFASSDYMDFWSNINAVVREARLYTLSGTFLWGSQPQNFTTIKYQGNPTTQWVTMKMNSFAVRNLPPSNVFVWVLYEIDTTWYARTYAYDLSLVPQQFWIANRDGLN